VAAAPAAALPHPPLRAASRLLFPLGHSERLSPCSPLTPGCISRRHGDQKNQLAFTGHWDTTSTLDSGQAFAIQAGVAWHLQPCITLYFFWHGTGQDIRLLVISMALAAGTRLHGALCFLSFLLSSFFSALHSYLLLLDIRSIDAGEASPPHASQLIQARPTKEHVYAPVWGISQPLHLPVHRANLRNVRVSCKTNQLRLIC
jgi:hypothetical protein